MSETTKRDPESELRALWTANGVPLEKQNELIAEVIRKAQPGCPDGPMIVFSKPDPVTELFGEVISSYSRAQAIEDGELVDVSETAREAGIKFPVALTRAVWNRCVEVPPRARCQDERGRLWDVLWMFNFAVKLGKIRGDVGTYTLRVHVREGIRNVTLKAVCGPGDDPAPVITIMLPDED